MLTRRNRYQKDACTVNPKSGPDVWVFRYREDRSTESERIGTVETVPQTKQQQ